MLKNLKKSVSLIAAFLMIGTMSVKAEVVVASAGPMTGDLAVFGEQLKYGAEMWEKDVNAKGGINGKKVKLVIGDDACDPKQAVAVANKLVGMGAVYVAGHFCSSSSIPASAVYSEAGVIQVSPASTNPNFTDKAKSDHIFRVCGRDDQQGEVAGKYIADNYKGKKVAGEDCLIKNGKKVVLIDLIEGVSLLQFPFSNLISAYFEPLRCPVFSNR